MQKFGRLTSSSHLGGWSFRRPPNTKIKLNKTSSQAKGLLIWTPFVEVYRISHGILRNYTHRTIDGIFWGGVAWGYDPIRGPYLNLPETSGGFQWGDLSAVEGIDQLSLSAWVRKSSAWGQDLVWAKHTSGTNGCFYLGSIAANTLGFMIINAASTRVDHNVAFAAVTDTWYHWVGVYNGVDMRTYINGIAQGVPSAQTGLIKNYTSILRLGDFDGAGWDFEGDVAEPRIYDKALSAGEVWEMYDAQTEWELCKPETPPLGSISPVALASSPYGPPVQVI